MNNLYQLRLSIIVLPLIVLSITATTAIADPLPNLVAAGDVTSTTAVLWARATAIGNLTFAYGIENQNLPGDPTKPVITQTEFTEFIVNVTDPEIPAKTEITGLVPGTTYFYRATDSAGATSNGRFKTPSEGIRAGLRFGVSGDWRGDLRPYPSIRNAADRGLDLFIALGDTIYADVPSSRLNYSQAIFIEEFRAKHDEVYAGGESDNHLGRLRSHCAILATIDDHEVSNDFAGGASPGSDARFAGDGVDWIHDSTLFKTGLQAFHEYNPIREEFYGDTGDPRTAGKLKLYRARTHGLDAAFFLLDARTFRDEPLPAIGATAPPQQIDDFLRRSFDPSRTMLGRAQLDELKADLLAATAAGVTWKFVLVPEPIQNLGPSLASDRFEGYAAERTELLRFIDDNRIPNVVFIAADIHGTLVNNLTYQIDYSEPQIPMRSWEITTGAVAYAAPFGPTVVSYIDEDSFGPIAGAFQFLYEFNSRAGRDNIVTLASRALLAGYGLDLIGLEFSPIAARLTEGGYVAVNTYGWTEFEIDAESQCLAVTTWGIDWYAPDDIAANAAEIASREPEIVSQFVVRPEESTHAFCPIPSASGDSAANSCGAGIFIGFPFMLIASTFPLRRRSSPK